LGSAENHRHDHQLVMIINNTWMHIMIIISIVISIKNVIIRTLLKHYNRNDKNHNNKNKTNEYNNENNTDNNNTNKLIIILILIKRIIIKK
jgi:hypothetical protein